MKKISLEGRKRIGELGTVDAVSEKKAQLMAMQQEHHKYHVEPVVPVKSQPLVVQQSELPLQQPTQHPIRQGLTVEFVVAQLTAMHQKLGKLGTRSTRHYSAQMVSNHLVKELREVLRQKAKEGVAVRLSDVDNMAACQAFIDEVTGQLLQRGIRLNHLRVVPLNC